MIAVDEAVKAADVELISMEASRDSKGGAGCGTLFYIGANDVSDARHAVENALEQLPKQFGEVYVNDAGHLSSCRYQHSRRSFPKLALHARSLDSIRLVVP